MRMIVFPGQGSQKPGMAKDFYDSFEIAKDTFHQVNDALGYNLTEIMLNGSMEELTKTENAQPAIMTASIAISKTLQTIDKEFFSKAHFIAGHSLGEFSSLCAIQSISLENTANILSIRGKAMQEAGNQKPGKMLALLSTTLDIAKDVVAKAQRYGICSIANDNHNQQIVISGCIDAINYIKDNVKTLNIRKAVPLAVSAAFHSPMMNSAEIKLSAALEKIHINNPLVPIITNVDARSTQNAIEIKQSLIKQTTRTVRWRESIEYAIQHGVSHFIEIGATNVLSQIIKKINPNVIITTINTTESLDSYIRQHA